MNAAMNNAAILKPIVFGDPDYFKLRAAERSSEKQPHWILSSDGVAYHAGLTGPVDNRRR